MVEIVSIVPERTILGEGPVWSVAEQALYWIDVKAPAIHRYDPATGEDRRWPMPERIGCLATRARGGLIGAFKTGFKLIDLDSGRIDPLVNPEADIPTNRFNDGRIDRLGRFWAGTMDDATDGQRIAGSLYRLDPGGGWRAFKHGVGVANGLGWSPDDRIMYFTDSPPRRIYAYDFHRDEGVLSNERVFVQVPDDAGWPDGLAVDAEGFVWGAHWAGGRVTRYAPDGSIDRVVRLPVPNVTSCTFGGPGLDTLYVTTASDGLTAEQLAGAPLAGNLFAIHGLGVRGQAETPFAG